MVKLSISVSVRPGKLLEFTQIMESLIKEYRTEKGCLSYDYQQDNKAENIFRIEAKWEPMEALRDHFRTHQFSILLGAFKVLCETPQVKIIDGSRTLGMEAIYAARGLKKNVYK
jgi:quinol monooxygenase YgiN